MDELEKFAWQAYGCLLSSGSGEVRARRAVAGALVRSASAEADLPARRDLCFPNRKEERLPAALALAASIGGPRTTGHGVRVVPDQGSCHRLADAPAEVVLKMLLDPLRRLTGPRAPAGGQACASP
jgi:hypothetical protein